MEFKDELKQYRKKNSLTQTQLAKMLGIDFTTVNRLENGHFNPSYEVLNKFHALQRQNGIQLESEPLSLSVSETNDIFQDVSSLIDKAKNIAYQSVNILLIQRNWMIGKRISEEELKETRKENYGLEIIKELSKKLTEKYGNGFGKTSLYNFLCFYKAYPNIFQTPFGQSFLSWSHYLVLLQVQDADARAWYEKEAYDQAWSVRTLQRNVSTQYYHRLLKSQKKDFVEKEMLEKAKDTNEDSKLEFIKNPAILEFLNIPECNDYLEKGLEKCLIQNIKKFLMELGKGYAFVTSQKRIHTEKDDYFIDLVFYNYILKCFVLIDLKIGKLSHQDVGQMDMYVKMYDEMEKQEDDKPTIGILLCSDTDEDVARYSNLHTNNQLYATKYKTYLPSENELKKEIERQKAFFYLQQSNKE